MECVFLNWKGRLVQIVPSRAPDVFVAVLRFLQQRLDELEYVELLCALEEIVDALNLPCAAKQQP